MLSWYKTGSSWVIHMKTKPLMNMKSHIFLSCLVLIFVIVTNDCRAQPISETLTRDQWTDTHLMVAAAMLCFLAASISSAGGIGGGGLYIPIMTIVTGVDLMSASTFSAFMVTGGSVANVVYYMFVRQRCLIDYDIALQSQPLMLLGVSVGVICNLAFPEWLITLLFAVFLAWSTFKTCTNGVKCWQSESLDLGANKEPLLGTIATNSTLPWLKLGVLVIIWFSFFFIYLLRHSRHGQIIAIEPCGAVYWVLSSLQIPLAIIFTASILRRKEESQVQVVHEFGQPNRLMFTIMALLAGILGGVFGIGGGMLISPLLIQLGMPPQITAATCSFMVFFSSTMSAIQYLLLGMEHTQTALIFSLVCFAGSLIGLVVVQRAIQQHGRASLIVFSVSTVMALSTVFITSFGAYHVWTDYVSGKYMGFKLPC